MLVLRLQTSTLAAERLMWFQMIKPCVLTEMIPSLRLQAEMQNFLQKPVLQFMNLKQSPLATWRLKVAPLVKLHSLLRFQQAQKNLRHIHILQ